MKKIQANHGIWAEKYRPQCIEDMILPKEMKDKFLKYMAESEVPNMLFVSKNPGTGKSSLVTAILKDLQADNIWINGSRDSTIETARVKISNFANSASLTEAPKLVVLDECLEENEEILLVDSDGNEYFEKIGNLEWNIIYNTRSINIETGKMEADTITLHSEKEDEIFEIELEDGRKILCNKDHPFFLDDGSILRIRDGLSEGQEIQCFVSGSNLISLFTISNIKSVERGVVRDITVHKNHTIVSKNGIISHNCDGMGDQAQKATRGIVEEYSKNTRFIFTANYEDKLIEPLRNRLVTFNFDQIFMENKKEIGLQIYNRLKFILENENVSYQVEDVKKIITAFYPSVRKMIMVLQNFENNGELKIQDNLINETSTLENILGFASEKNFTQVRNLINDLPDPEHMYSYMNKNIEAHFTELSYPYVIVAIAKYMDMSERSRDKTITLSACFVEIMNNQNVSFKKGN